MTTIKKIDIHELAESRKQIAVIWSIEDVKEVRPDLNDEQAYTVLQSCRDNHDANYGITWDDIGNHADSIYPTD